MACTIGFCGHVPSAVAIDARWIGRIACSVLDFLDSDVGEYNDLLFVSLRKLPGVVCASLVTRSRANGRAGDGVDSW